MVSILCVLYLFLQIHIETAKNGSCRRGFDVGVQPEGKVLLCYKKATTVLQKCCKSATTVLQLCYRDATVLQLITLRFTDAADRLSQELATWCGHTVDT